MNVLRVTSIVVLLLGSVRPVTGQEPAAAAAFSPAVIRRTVAAAAREVVAEPRVSGQGRGDWSAVRRLSAGTEIVVTAATPLTGPQEVLDVDDASLTVLNGDGVKASGHGAEIRRLAKTDPRTLARAAHGGSITSGDLRLAPEGVFIDGRKTMELRQILVSIPRADVTEINRASRDTGLHAAAGGFLGFVGGAFLGGMVGLKIGEIAGADPSNIGPIFLGVLAGGVTGLALGYAAADAPGVGETLIYQAPASPRARPTP